MQKELIAIKDIVTTYNLLEILKIPDHLIQNIELNAIKLELMQYHLEKITDHYNSSQKIFCEISTRHMSGSMVIQSSA